MPGDKGCPKHLIEWCEITPWMWVQSYSQNNPHLVVLAAIIIAALLAGPMARRFMP